MNRITAGLDSIWLRRTQLLLWLTIILSFLAVYIQDLRLSYDMISRPCEHPDCHYQAIGAAEVQALSELGLSLQGYSMYMLGITILGVLIFFMLAVVMLWRLYPRRSGFIFSAMLIILPTTTITSFDVVIAANPAWSVPISLLWIFGLAATVYFFLIFPNGRLEPRISLILPPLLIAADYLEKLIEPVSPYMWFIYLPIFAAILMTVIYRYRRIFDRTQRQQTRWVVFGSAMFLAGVPIWAYTFQLAQPDPGRERLILMIGGWTITNLLMLALPGTIFAAILRYRLWDIDLILRKTLVYTLLTAILIGIYLAIVTVFQNLFAANTGQDSPLANVLSTLIIAALFHPARQRLQRSVNRLFFGDRDDPYVVLSRLGQQLQDTPIPNQTLTAITTTLCQTLKLPYAAIIMQGANGERTPAASSGNSQPNVREWPLRFQGLPVGWLAVSPRVSGEEFTPQEERLLSDVASHAGAATRAAQLTSSLQHAREKLVLAREEERRRLRRDLHDGLGPTLASQTFVLDSAIDLLQSNPSDAAELLQNLKNQNQALVADIRRLVYELRPPALDELGLVDAINAFIQQLNSHSPTHLKFTPQSGSLEKLPAAVEAAIYRLVQEGVNNVLHHAQANYCSIESFQMDGQLTITIRDDGCGIPANARSGVGMLSMRERVEELGGKLTISPASPAGTLLTAVLPYSGEKNE